MLNFKIAQASDLIQLSKFVNAAYRGGSSQAGWTSEADLLAGQRTDPQSLKSHISGNRQVILIFQKQKKSENDLQYEGEFEACVYLRNEYPNAYLGMLSVNPQAQAKGTGRFVLETAEKWVQENWQSEFVRMTVISLRKELIDWYLRRGYSFTGEKENFPYGDEKFGQPKRDDLEFVVLKKSLR